MWFSGYIPLAYILDGEFEHNSKPLNMSLMSSQFQISPAPSPEIWHHTVWRIWLFITYTMNGECATNSLNLPYVFLFQNVGRMYFELGSERIKPRPNSDGSTWESMRVKLSWPCLSSGMRGAAEFGLQEYVCTDERIMCSRLGHRFSVHWRTSTEKMKKQIVIFRASRRIPGTGSWSSKELHKTQRQRNCRF